MPEPRTASVDPYGVLTLQPTAPQQLVDEAYWLLSRLAREQLPRAASEARISELTAAYEELATPDRRGARDRMDAADAEQARAPRRISARGGTGSDYYSILHIDVHACTELIELAYSIALRQVHARAESTSEMLSEARETLLDPESRADYNATLGIARRLDHETEIRQPAKLRVIPGTQKPSQPQPATRLPLRPVYDEGRASPAEGGVNLAVLDDELSARRVITNPQKAAGITLAALVVAGFILFPASSLIAFIAITAALYAAAIGYKGYLAGLALASPSETPVGVHHVDALVDEVLPIYTVILPLFRETEVLGGLVASINALDYPEDRLDIKFLLEEDDTVMQEAVAALDLPSHFETLVIPAIGPQGKPRACNHGLARARGTYLALYDAEDRPEPDQLKKALVAFSMGGKDVACVQAKLNFYNPDQNLLTKWFTIEYSTWFDLYLPALNRLGVPIPLGGTSNHFRIDLLRAAGAWDAYNVTEDADLGVRLARYHLKTSVIDSVTYEEANSRLGNWLRQRSRWVKGYMQTWLVHMRHPITLFRDLGPAGFLTFQVMVLGTFLTYFANPVFWALLVAWYTTHAAGIQALYPGPILYISALAFFAGNFMFVFTAVAGSLQRNYYHGVKYALLNHIYWALMSIASWKALVQLVMKPHYWEKTQHGLDTVAAREGGSKPR